MSARAVPGNPLVRLARACPAAAGAPLALAARGGGGALLAAVALDQTYDRTRVLATALAALALLSCLPVSASLRERIAWMGAGVLFFGGSLLAHLPAGRLALLCGVLAAAGAAIDEGRSGRRTRLPAFFAGFGVVLVVVAGVVLRVEG